MTAARSSSDSPCALGLQEADAAIQHEMLRSDRKRVLALMTLIGFMLCVVGLTSAFPNVLRDSVRVKILAAMPRVGSLGLAYLVYEGLVYFWLGRLLRSSRLPPLPLRFVNVFIEVSLPTLAMIVGSPVMGKLEALLGVPPFLYAALIFLSALNLDWRLCAFGGVAAGTEYLCLGLYYLHTGAGDEAAASGVTLMATPHQFVVKSLVLVASGAAAALVSAEIRRQLVQALDAMNQRERAISIFGQHVSPQVAGLLLNQHVDVSGQVRNVCIMFLDIRDFSVFAARSSAPEVMAYLNTLFGSMIPSINAHHGVVNKFLGDGFMAVFGAPLDDDDHCRHAIQAAQDILRRLDAMNAGGAIPQTRIGIGLHAGPAMTGNVGANERKEYTIIGDSVNLAARIEQATKAVGARLLVSEEVASTLHDRTEFPMEDLGPVELKGQPRPVRLFRLA